MNYENILEDSLSSSKLGKKNIKKVKSCLIGQMPKSKLTKPQLPNYTNESANTQSSFQKSRSFSALKLKSSHSNSSLLNFSNTHSSQNKSKIPTPSQKPSFQKPVFLSLPVSVPKTQIKAIEENLISYLKSSRSKLSIKNTFEAYQNTFQEIIEIDETYGGLLKKIKEAYDLKIKHDSIETSKDANEKLKEEVLKLKLKISKKNDEQKNLIKKIEKLAKENAELGRDLDDRENRYIDLQNKLIKLSKFSIDHVPQDENSWKYVVSENQHLLKVCKDMRKDIKHLSRKEKNLIKLIIAFKDKGFPVEEIYQQLANKKKTKNKPSEVVDNTEDEDLVSGRPKPVKKPAVIPSLTLTSEKSESSLSSSSED